MDEKNLDRNLTCILFPGNVKNEEKAIQCLGGIKGISQIYSQPTKKRLGLSFQPENPYVKKVYGDNRKTAGVLLKVKVKKTVNGDEVNREVMSTSVLGRVKRIYKFESMGDFQYLPVVKEGQAEPQCIIENIMPSGLDEPSFISEPAQVPIYITPSNFTRTDKPFNYSYTDKRYPEKNDDPYTCTDVIHNKTRSERTIEKLHINFNLTDEFPTEPNEQLILQKIERAKVYPQLEEEYEIVQKHFKERPIWSHNLLKYHTKIKSTSLNVLLPCFGFYMRNGPWNKMWIRYGYDPRKEPGARVYQNLDFRIRHEAGIHSMVMTRCQMGYYKKAQRVRYSKNDDEAINTEEVPEGAVIFRPGIAPAQRQIFYMYCDVHLPEVQEIIAPEPPAGYLCHEKRGWLPPNANQVARDHISRYVKETLLASHNADIKFEQGSSDDMDSDDDATEETQNTPMEVDVTPNT